MHQVYCQVCWRSEGMGEGIGGGSGKVTLMVLECKRRSVRVQYPTESVIAIIVVYLQCVKPDP
jgi:hypothetical protein